MRATETEQSYRTNHKLTYDSKPGTNFQLILRIFVFRNLVLLFFIAAIPTFNGCVVLRQIKDPLTGILTRYHCISVDLPAITLTPERTAAERQLIGENRRIEKDGWLIASSQNTSFRRIERNGNSGKQSEKSDIARMRHLYRERGVLEFYQTYIEEYRNRRRLVGEDLNGKLKLIPVKYRTRKESRIKPAERKKLNRILSEVNRSRIWIYKYYRSLENRRKNPDLERIKKEQLSAYATNAPSGVWIRIRDGGWIRKD